MADALIALLRTRAFGLLDQARRALQASGVLANLARAGPEWEGTPLAGHLRAAVPAPGPLEPLASQVVNALRALGVRQPGVTAGLFGWDVEGDGVGPARGIAWAVRLTDSGSTLAAALGHEPEGPTEITIQVTEEIPQRAEQQRVRAITDPQQYFLRVRATEPTGRTQQVRDRPVPEVVPQD
jgi:hypothetical protein